MYVGDLYLQNSIRSQRFHGSREKVISLNAIRNEQPPLRQFSRSSEILDVVMFIYYITNCIHSCRVMLHADGLYRILSLLDRASFI